MAHTGLNGKTGLRRGGSVKLPLREHRVRSRVSLEEIAEQTKITKRFLEAIEEADYDSLPGGVFRTSYIRQYASAIGYDAELILEHCRELSAGEESSSEEPLGRERAALRLMRFLQLG